MKPLEIKDFSGGETDNYFRGEQFRAERLWNLFVGIDHSLDSRQGSLVKNNAAKAERINYIQSFNALTELLYASEGHFYDIDGVETLGPDGNIAFVGATSEAMYTSSEMQDHLYVAIDEKLQPQKFCKDSLGALQVRTAGLPKVTRTQISEAALLAECITAANALRTVFLNHINSAENLDSERDGISANYALTTLQPVTSTNAHWSVDKYAKSYLQAVVFSGGQWQPQTIPTPAPAATDYATLVTLIEALNLAFEEHRIDSAGYAAIDDSGFINFTFGPNRYHALGYQTQYTDGTINFGYDQTAGGFIPATVKPVNQGIQQKVVANPNPDASINASIPENDVYRTKLESIALFLDDFAIKFCLHETAPMVHRYNYQNAQGNAFVDAAFAHQFLEPILSKEPVVIPTPFNFIYAANFVQRAFKNHAMNTDVKSSTDLVYASMHTAENSSIVSGLQQAGYYFATLPPTPTIRQQATAFKWDVICAKLAIFTARYSYFVHNLDLLAGASAAYVDVTTVTGLKRCLINIANSSAFTTGKKGQVIIRDNVLFPNPLASTIISTETPKRQRIQCITNVVAGGPANDYDVTYPVVAALSSATGAAPFHMSIGTFVMHPYPMRAQAASYPNFNQTTQYLPSFGYSPDIYNLAGWIDLIKGFYDAFKAHLADVNTHLNVATGYLEFLNTDPVTNTPAGGTQYFPLSNLLPTVDLPNTQPQFILPDTSGAGPAITSYGYAWTYSDTYTAESGVTYRVESAPVFSEAIDSEETMQIGYTQLMYGETAIYLTNEIITPVAMVLGAEDLVNTLDTNYATTLLNTYRTTGGGTTFFKIDMLAATPLTSLVWPTITLLGSYDLVSDKYSINGNAPLNDSQDTLYTNGGVSPSNQPPKCKYTWAANDYVYYGGVYDGDTFLPNRALQSVQLAGDWVPSQNYVDFSSPIVGGGAARNVNVCLTEKGVFRLEGNFGKDGSGAIVKQQISNEIGGISGSSIVVTEVGIFFAGTNGFYYTDGYQCIRISQERVKAFNAATKLPAQKRALKGVYDRTNRRIFWTCRKESTSTDNDVIYAYDLNFGITPSGTFTTIFGATGSWNPSALGFLGNICFIGDTDGYLYYLDENTKTDPLKDTLTAPNTWLTTYIPWEYRSCMMDFGGTAMRKFFSRIHHVGKNRGDVAIQYYITADNRVTQDLAPMRFIDPGNTGLVDQWRRVGGKKLRADLYQVGARNGRFTVYNSDELAGTPVFVSHIGADTTIDMLNTLIPLDSVGMSICFASDYYATEFVIKSVVHGGLDSTLVLVDPLNKANNLLALGWEIRGFMKDQAFSLDALTIWFEEQGNLGSQYRGYSSTEGGGGNK